MAHNGANNAASPRVSVICIFRDAERFIREALDSVLAQDFGDFELLLVDDGSKDASTAIAREFAAEMPGKVRYLEHEGHAHRGMSATRNLGLRECRGELVAFIDSDDVWRPHKLREQVAILDSNPGVGMVCGTVNYWSSWQGSRDKLVPTGHIRDAISRPPMTNLRLYPLGTADAPCPSDVMARTSVLSAVGGFEEEFTGFYEDQALFAKLYLAVPVYFSSSVWLDYRQHDDSCVSTVNRAGLRPQLQRRFLDWFADYIESREIPGEERIRREIARARWELDHPRLGKIRRRLRLLAGKLRS